MFQGRNFAIDENQTIASSKKASICKLPDRDLTLLFDLLSFIYCHDTSQQFHLEAKQINANPKPKSKTQAKQTTMHYN